MVKLANKQSGFSSFESILLVLIILLIGFVGWYVYKNQSTTSSSSLNTSATIKTVNPYEGWNTYVSADGRFGFKYPGSYKLDNQPNIDIFQNVKADFIRLTSNGANKDNNFGIDLTLYYSLPSSLSASSTVDTFSNGTTSVLTNKLTLWQSKHVQTYASGSITNDCPSLQVGTDNTFVTKLPNNKYLTIFGSFCWGQGISTTYSYSDILKSAEWKNAVGIIESVHYN